MYALIENASVKKYPYDLRDLKLAHPNTSFPAKVDDATFKEFGAEPVLPSTPPAYDLATQVLVEGTPAFFDDAWHQVWSVRSKTAEELAQHRQNIQSEVVSATQERLDTFARTRNYDGILSACTYATSTVPKFAAEGQYCVVARDATWRALYTIMAEVQAGTRAMPATFQDIEADLPALSWPE